MPAIAWSRPEPFGAWLRLADDTLVAVDRDLAARVGVEAGRGLGRVTRPLELHMAVTTRCPAPCTGCYLDARPDGYEPDLHVLVERLRAAREAGVSTVAFGGGEPLTRTDLPALAKEARSLGLVPVLTTSGIGLTEDRVEELRAFAQVNVSHDGTGGAYEAVRGFDAALHAERAIAMLARARIPVGVNLVLTRDSFPHVEATSARAHELGASELQLLRYKPAGRADEDGYAAKRLGDREVAELWPLVARLVAAKKLRVRIDCAMVPLLSDGLLEALPDAAAALGALGVFGCEAARHLGALTASGEPRACSFFSLTAPTALRKTRDKPGEDDDLGRAWDGDARLAAIRSYHAAPSEPCASCALFAVCRGGCQVVARRSSSRFGPDPECPRVQRLEATR